MKSISAIHPPITENTENTLVKHASQRLIIGNPVSQYASYSAMFCPLHSNIGKEQHEKHVCIQLLQKIQRIYSWNERPISRYVTAITSQFLRCRTRFIHNKQGIAREVLHWSLCLVLKPFCVYRKLSPYAVVKKRMGDQRGTKVAPWCKHCSSCSWWKGTSRDEATLISEEIKSLALAVFELCLSEGISK